RGDSHGANALARLQDAVESRSFCEIFEDRRLILWPRGPHLFQLKISGGDHYNNVVFLRDSVEQLRKNTVLLRVHFEYNINTEIENAHAMLGLCGFNGGFEREQEIVKPIRVVLLESLRYACVGKDADVV